ncbi:MAG TPA: hypothetical protein VHW96_06580 [Solirubrobacteraceae bacterium]|jgi:hypothetical protein|nr:hypothetical protein [Solirubrobacteraceae bacterium]
MSTGPEPVRAPDFGLGENGHEAPTQQLATLTTAAGDHCGSCGAPLASDQRYCVNCGQRRGKPRFTLAEPAATETVTATSGRPPRRTRRPRASSSFTLIAGIATLLLAMGVGVLIGHNSAGTQRAASSQPLKINVNSGGSSAATTPTTTAGGNTANGGGSTSKSKPKSSKASAKAARSKPSAAQTAKAGSAASKVLGGSNNTAPATVTQGASCSNTQAGCQNGHFTGNNFFGQ